MSDAGVNAPRRRNPSSALRPGRVDQTESRRTLALSAAGSLALIVGSAVAAWFVPIFAFFAVGAGAGYSLSGSV